MELEVIDVLAGRSGAWLKTELKAADKLARRNGTGLKTELEGG